MTWTLYSPLAARQEHGHPIYEPAVPPPLDVRLRLQAIKGGPIPKDVAAFISQAVASVGGTLPPDVVEHAGSFAVLQETWGRYGLVSGPWLKVYLYDGPVASATSSGVRGLPTGLGQTPAGAPSTGLLVGVGLLSAAAGVAAAYFLTEAAR